jgi:uncharacterized protein YjlB
MITHDVKTKIFVFKMSDMKKDILKAISLMGTHSIFDDAQQISNSDWHLNSGLPRPYFDIVDNEIHKCLNEIKKEEKYNKTSITNFWFQQYNQGDYHGWHNHADCVYSSVYYVELPNQTSTTFESNGKEFKVDVEEGDYIVFPSIFRHCSKENKTSKTKTVISININME